nr:hypothetical protein [Tanacetum cinerariifolium]
MRKDCKHYGVLMIESHLVDKLLKEVLMIECVIHTVKTNMVIYTTKIEMVKLVVEIECVGMNADEFDKETGSSDGLQPEQADLNCIHALNEPHLHEIHVVPKRFQNSQAKGERKSLVLKANKESSDKECSTSRSEDEEYAMAVRDFKKFLKRRECPKPPKDNNQRAFIRGSCSDSDEEDDKKAKDKTCLVAQASNEICLGVDLEPYEWIKDSGCSKHMTGNQNLFSTYKAYNRGNVIFGSNLCGQICDNKCRKTFSEYDSEITKDDKVIVWFFTLNIAPAGRLYVWYVIRVVTLRALVHAGDKTSGDARSWYMIIGDDKSWIRVGPLTSIDLYPLTSIRG